MLGAGLLALTALTGCTASGSTDGSQLNGKSAAGANTVTSAPPGKYQVLPEPCGTVSQNTLKALLPGAADYNGEAALTYDTDRRVGCKWSGKDSQGTRSLNIDLERVVSYDPSVSDESQAEQDYTTKAIAAGVPVQTTASPSPTGSGSPSTSGSASASGTASASASASSSSASASDSASPPGSRTLTHLGDDAYLDDALTTRGSGVHRDITIVFREANVLVTVTFVQWSTDKSGIPDSTELQDDAQRIAGEIAHQFD